MTKPAWTVRKVFDSWWVTKDGVSGYLSFPDESTALQIAQTLNAAETLEDTP